MNTILHYIQLAIDHAVRYAPRVVITLILAVVGWKLISLLCGTLQKAMIARKIDDSLRPFITSLLGYLLKTALIITLLSNLGIPTAPLVAVLGAAGIAVGLALSGTLQNFAGGVVILFLRPIRVGEFVEVAGFLGKVQEITIFHTVLISPDNRTIYIPNSAISNAAVTNFARQTTRRADLIFGIGYNDDIDAAKAILNRLVEGDDRILKDPPPLIAVENLGDSSVDILVRIWAKSEDFLAVQQHFRETAKKTFDAEGVSIPFPQRDVHLIPAPGSDDAVKAAG